MSVVRLLGFATLPCGCVVGRYRDVGSTREIVYVEEKGAGVRQPRPSSQPHGVAAIVSATHAVSVSAAAHA